MDKRQTLDCLLADIFREPPLIPTHITPPPATYFDEAESETSAFDKPESQPQLIPTHRTPPATYFDEPESETAAAPGLDVDTAPQVPAAVEVRTSAEPYASPELPISAKMNISAAEEKTVRLAEQSKALLAGLNFETAARLRWAMRDIKAKRIKLTPVAPNDLEALLDLGFVAIVDEKPVLTDAGFLALD